MFEIRANPSAQGRGLGLVLIAAMLWGTVGIITRALYQTSDANPLSVGFFRMALGTPVLAILCWRALGRSTLRIARRDLLLMLLLGITLGLSQVCYFTAIAYSGVTVATLITLCVSPVLVAIISAALGRESITPVTVVGLVCALGGTWLLVGLGPGGMLSGSAATGALFALGSAVCYGVFTVTSRHLAQHNHPLQSITIGFAVGSLMLLILAVSTGFETRYDAQGWAMLVYLGSVPSALAYSLFLIGMRSVTATLASISMLMEPLTAAVLAWLLFGERLGPLGFAGAALLLGAIGVMFISQRQPEAVTSNSG